MVSITEETIKKFEAMMEEIDNKPLKNAYQNFHQGYPDAILMRFLKARNGNVSKAHKMLIDCLNWRVQNEIENILTKPIEPPVLYREIRNSQLMGVCGYSNDGLPVIAIGAGLSTCDKASDDYYVQSHIQMNEYIDHVVLPAAGKKHGRYIDTCLYVFDMTGLNFSALKQLKLLNVICDINEENYPEKGETYFIVNAPYIFSACWGVVKPLLHENTKKKVKRLSGCGKDELLKIMDYDSLPHFCKGEGSTDNCFTLDHTYHKQMYSYIKDKARLKGTYGL